MRAGPIALRWPTTGRASGRLTSTFSALSVSDFRNLWLGSFASQIGMWVQQVALGWLAYDLTGSATFLGVLATARSIPSVLVTLPAGVFADRWDRRRIVLASQLFTLVPAVILAWLVATGNVAPWHLLVATFVSGIAHSLNMPARQSLAPALAGYQHTANAVALNSISFNTSRVLGPSVAGILVWISGVALCYMVQAVLLLTAVLFTLAIRSPGRGHGAAAHGSIVGNLLEGVRFINRVSLLRTVFLVASVPILIGSIYNQLMPVFARDVLEIGPTGMGALMSAVGLGSVLGSFGLAAVSSYPHKGRIMIGMGLGAGVSLAAFATSHWFGLSLVLLCLCGFFLVFCLGTGQTLLTLNAPNEYRGRVLSMWSMVWSLEPIALVPAGILTDYAGPQITVFTCGLLVLGFFVFLTSRPGALRDYHDRISTADRIGAGTPARA